MATRNQCNCSKKGKPKERCENNITKTGESYCTFHSTRGCMIYGTNPPQTYSPQGSSSQAPVFILSPTPTSTPATQTQIPVTIQGMPSFYQPVQAQSRPPVRPQCAMILEKTHEQCKRSARAGSIYCEQHHAMSIAPNEFDPKLKRPCPYTKRSGELCTLNCLPGKGACISHLSQHVDLKQPLVLKQQSPVRQARQAIYSPDVSPRSGSHSSPRSSPRSSPLVRQSLSPQSKPKCLWILPDGERCPNPATENKNQHCIIHNEQGFTNCSYFPN